MIHVISFRRPEQKHVLTKLSVPPHEDVMMYVRRLENLGYKVMEITPPIDQQGPPQKPGLKLAGETGWSPQNDTTPPPR